MKFINKASLPLKESLLIIAFIVLLFAVASLLAGASPVLIGWLFVAATTIPLVEVLHRVKTAPARPDGAYRQIIWALLTVAASTAATVYLISVIGGLGVLPFALMLIWFVFT